MLVFEDPTSLWWGWLCGSNNFRSLMEILENIIETKITNFRNSGVWLKQHGTTRHTASRLMELLRELFPQYLISLRGDGGIACTLTWALLMWLFSLVLTWMLRSTNIGQQQLTNWWLLYTIKLQKCRWVMKNQREMENIKNRQEIENFSNRRVIKNFKKRCGMENLKNIG